MTRGKPDAASMTNAAAHCSWENPAYVRSQRQCCGLSEDPHRLVNYSSASNDVTNVTGLQLNSSLLLEL